MGKDDKDVIVIDLDRDDMPGPDLPADDSWTDGDAHEEVTRFKTLLEDLDRLRDDDTIVEHMSIEELERLMRNDGDE